MSDSLTSEPESDFVCGCAEHMRSACSAQPFYKEHEGKRYCVLHFPRQEKSADFAKTLQRKLEKKDFDFQGVWFPEDVSFFRFRFDGEADFSSATFNKSANFESAVFFARADFDSSTFCSETTFARSRFMAPASFLFAIFEGPAFFSYATFEANATFAKSVFRETASAYFTCVTFRRAGFGNTTFNSTANFCSSTFAGQAQFESTIFGAEAYFAHATFCGPAEFAKATFRARAIFTSATFNTLANFSFTTFVSAVDHSYVSFLDYARFAGKEGWSPFGDQAFLDLQFSRIGNPEHISFYMLPLRPHWFVNVDSRKFEFRNIDWDLRNPGAVIRYGLESLKIKQGASAHGMLAIACRHLAANAEDNNRYEDASRFRYMAMDVRRREKWRWFAPWRLSWWYWVASGYGERAAQAFFVLLVMLLLSALLYTQVGFVRWEPRLASESDAAVAVRDGIGAPLPFRRALAYSAAVMTFQKPEPRPATTAAQTIVLLETILGPVQAALLALAIRRKFMR